MNHPNSGAFQAWGGGGQPQQPHPQQQVQQHAQNNNAQLQQFQQMQQQMLFQQQHQGLQGGHNQMTVHMGMEHQGNTQMNYQQQLPSQPQLQQHMTSTHDQGSAAQGMMTPNSWMQQAQQQQQQQQPSAPAAQGVPQHAMMNMMGGGGQNNEGGMVSHPQQSQQQQQAALYWNVLQSQQQGANNQGFSMMQQQQQPSQQPLQQQQMQMQLQQQQQQMQQQQSHQHQGMMAGGMMSGLPQVTMSNEGGMNNVAQSHSAMNSQQQLQQFFAMQQTAQQQGPSNNTNSAPPAASSGQQQLHYQQSQGQQQQFPQNQQPPQDKSSSSSSSQQPRQNQAQLHLQQQNLISQLQRRIQQQRQPQNNSSSTPTPAAATTASPPTSSTPSNNFMGGLMQQGLPQVQQQQQQQPSQQFLQLQMHPQQNLQQGMYAVQGQNVQQPRGNINTNAQVLLMAQQQQQQQQQQGQHSSERLQQQHSLQQYSQQAQAQAQAMGFQRDTSTGHQQQQIELMMQQQQQHLGSNDTNQQQLQYQQNLSQQQQSYNMSQNKSVNNGEFSSFSTQFPPNNDIMSPSLASITSQQEPRQLPTDSSFTQQQQVRQTSNASAPGPANQAGDLSRMGMNQSQQQQFMLSQMPQGAVNLGGGQVAKNDNNPSVNNAPVPGIVTAGVSAVASEEPEDELSLDQRVKQFEMMQQQQMSLTRQQQQQLPNGVCISSGDGSSVTQTPAGVEELLPSHISSQPQEEEEEEQQQQQQQQNLNAPQQQQEQATTISSLAGASFSVNDDVSEALEFSEPQNALGLVRAGSPGSLGVAEPDPIVDGATIIRSEGAINVIAPARRGAAGGGGEGGASDELGAHNSSSVGTEQGEAASEQPFLDGHFAGGWQSNADLPDRRQIIFSIIKVIERKRPDTNRMSQNRLPLMAKKLEEHLYRSAHLKDAYIDLASLKKRLHLIAKGVGIPKSYTPSDSSTGTDPSLMFTTSPTGDFARGSVTTPASVVNSLQPVVATSQGSVKSFGSNVGNLGPNVSKDLDANEPLPISKKELLSERPRSERAGDNSASSETELDRLNKDMCYATVQEPASDVSAMETDDDENSEKRKVILQQQQRRLLLLRHASKCREGMQCRVKFCPQMVTLWKHMKTCRDKNCKAAHCLSSRCVLNHYRICKSEGLTSTCAICAPVMKHIRMKESSSESNDPEVLNRLGGTVDTEHYGEMPVDGESDEQDTSDSFKALKEALVSDLPKDPSDQTAEEKSTGQQPYSKQLESDTQNQGGVKPSDANELRNPQSPGKNLQNQEGKRTSDNVDGGNSDSRPSKVLKRNSSAASATASLSSDGSTTKKSSSLITSMEICDIEAHLDSLLSGRLTPRNISRKCIPIVKKLSEHENGWIFNEPVDPVELGIHDYFDVIDHPMDLDLVAKKLQNGVYWDIASFRKDTRLVFENAILYNGKDSDVGVMAKELLDIFEQELSLSFRGMNVDEEAKKTDSCSLCGNHRRLYESPSLFCSGTCSRNIRRNASYFTDRMKQNQWCETCYAELKDDECLLLDNGKETKKAYLQQMKNDKSPEEKWVQCDKCQDWVHQVCALFNGTQNYKSASFTCPKCHIKSDANSTPSTAPKGAVDLPQCKLSESIEKGIAQTLSKAYEKVAKERDCSVSQVEKAENLYVRVVSNLEKKQKVREGMKARYSKANYPSEFPVTSKCILLFQKIHGVDVLLFSMYVYEYGDKCPAPNRRRVYISYLDSVRYLTPAQYRTAIYQSVLIEYLRFVKLRGFHTAHIWSCPPAKGDEYIFYCHPVNQLTPRNDMLCAWYNDALQKAKAEGIALDIRTLYDDYFKDNVVNRKTGEPFDPTSLPYFDGDYVPGEIEKIIKDLDEDDNRREGTKIKDTLKVASAPSKTEGNRAGTRSNPGRLVNQGRDKVMNRLDLIMSRMKENFFVVQLLSNEFIDAVEGDTGITSWVEGGAPGGDGSAETTRIIGKNPYILDLSEKKDTDAENRGDTTSFPLYKQVIEVSTEDKDPLVEQECFETRLQFLNYCQKHNYQFDELRRAKYSSAMVLAYLHNPREEQEQLIKAHLDVIAHAASCQGCVSKNCQKMKQLFDHVRGCELTHKRGCKVCTRLFMLLIKHARDCPTDGAACPIPFCERIKERNRMLLKQQQLMDDRRRNAQNVRAKEDSA